MNPIEHQFRQLAAQADATWERSRNDLYEMEPCLCQILDFVKSHPDERETFARLFSELVQDVDYNFTERGRKASTWILGYAMRDLKWPEVREAIEARQRTERDPSIRERFLRWILRAYDPQEWDYDIYFHRYGRAELERKADAELEQEPAE